MPLYCVIVRATVYVLGDGKVTIPKAIRDQYGLEQGDTVEIEVIADE